MPLRLSCNRTPKPTEIEAPSRCNHAVPRAGGLDARDEESGPSAWGALTCTLEETSEIRDVTRAVARHEMNNVQAIEQLL
jgi:hypothetical protein